MSEQTITSIRLAPGVRLLTAPDKVSVLHIRERQIYVRLGSTAVEIVRLLEGHQAVIPEDIYQHLTARYHLQEKRMRRLLDSFLTGLDRLGALAHY